LGAFGEKLRKQREQQGITLDVISGTTKISTRMLRALEDEHFDQLPGGVFNKGFVRAYARQVGLDEEEAIADYLAAVRESQHPAHSASPDLHPPSSGVTGSDPAGTHAPNNRSHQLLADDQRNDDPRNEDRRHQARRSEDRRNEDRGKKKNRGHENLASLPDPATHNPAAHLPAERRPKYPAGTPERSANFDYSNNDGINDVSARIPWGKLAAALLLVTFALAIWNSRRHRETSPAAPRTAVSQQTSAPVTAPVPSSSPASSLAVGKASSTRTSPSGKLSAGTVSASSTSLASNASATPASPVSPPALKAALTAPANLPNTNPAVAEAAASPAPKSQSTFSLLIRAEENSWVSITADGKPVAQETLIAPAHTSVRATGEVVVKAGNAAGISFQLNGEEIPAQGNEGEVKTYVFDAAGFRVLPQPQSPAANR
jgi:cytoskeletal protein RodZ